MRRTSSGFRRHLPFLLREVGRDFRFCIGQSTSGSGIPRRQARLQDDLTVFKRCLVRFRREDVENEPGRALADLAASLVDAGERHANLADIMQIAAADDRQFLWHRDALA